MRKILVALFVLLLPSSALAASLSISPSAGSFQEGQRILVNIQVSSDAAMNAASGVVGFPTDLLSVEYVNKGSVLNFWVTEPSYSNAAGTVKFEGVSLSGFQGSNGSVLTVAFRAKKTGTANIQFRSGQILANDGQGTDITGSVSGAAFTILPKSTITPSPVQKPEPAVEEKPEPTSEPVIERKPQLVPPVVSLGSQEGIPAIIGRSAYSKSDALVTFTSSDGSKIFVTSTTDTDGNFVSLVPRVLRSGSYHVTAVIVLPNSTATEPSSPLLVVVGGALSIDLTIEMLFYSGLLLLTLIGGALYIGRRLASSKPIKHTKILKETHEAESVLHKSFALLRQDLRTYLKDRRKSRGEADDDLESLSDDLDQAEEFIEKEIRDIENTTENAK